MAILADTSKLYKDSLVFKPEAIPWSNKSASYWHEQYQLMCKKHEKQVDRIRELEEHLIKKDILLSKKDFFIDEIAESLHAMVAHHKKVIKEKYETRNS